MMEKENEPAVFLKGNHFTRVSEKDLSVALRAALSWPFIKNSGDEFVE